MTKPRPSAGEKLLDAVMRAGNTMSNVCYNLSQCEGVVLTRRHCESMRLSQLEWDNAVEKRAQRKAKP